MNGPPGLRHTAVAEAAGARDVRHSAVLSPAIVPALLNEDQAAAFFNVSVRRFHELRGEPWMRPPRSRWDHGRPDGVASSLRPHS